MNIKNIILVVALAGSLSVSAQDENKSFSNDQLTQIGQTIALTTFVSNVAWSSINFSTDLYRQIKYSRDIQDVGFSILHTVKDYTVLVAKSAIVYAIIHKVFESRKLKNKTAKPAI